MSSEVSNKNLRIFGLIWALIFAYLAHKNFLFPKIFFALSCIVATVSILQPQAFVKSGIYSSWIKFGNFMGKINGFLISFVLFYAIFTPVSFALKLLKKDPLNKKLKPESASYFIDRKAQPGDMKNQF
jgi:hypothetical protein